MIPTLALPEILKSFCLQDVTDDPRKSARRLPALSIRHQADWISVAVRQKRISRRSAEARWASVRCSSRRQRRKDMGIQLCRHSNMPGS